MTPAVQRFRQLEIELDLVQAYHLAARNEAQLSCPHERIVEAPFQPEGQSDCTVPPFRVCTDCGFAEEGWSCGYQILGRRQYNAFPIVSRTAAARYQRGKLWPNHYLVASQPDRRTARELLAAYFGGERPT